jgi:TfoX/Sxy family transcriptional regulator of competence genes
MAVSDSFLTFVLEQLDGVRQVTSRRMFGGAGLYSAEVFFGVLDNDRLYFKVDDTNVGDYSRAGMEPFRPYPNSTRGLRPPDPLTASLAGPRRPAPLRRGAPDGAPGPLRGSPNENRTPVTSRITDQTMTMKYYEVPVSVLEDGDELAVWARKAIAVAEGSRGSRRARRTMARRRS